MAQDYFSRLSEAVKQAESGGRRYDERGKLLEGPKTKYGTAKGEMQVLDRTFRDPGFGVTPAVDDSAEERARVGRDLLRAFSERYNSLDATLAAYNWGPGNTDKWLRSGADPSKLPKETRDYIERVKSRLGGEPRPAEQATRSGKSNQGAVLMPAAPKEVMSPVQKPVVGRQAAAPVVTQEVLDKLGANYQAALAAMSLADTRDDDDDEVESIAERYIEDRGLTLASEPEPRSTVIADMDLGYQSPFDIIRPKQAAQPVRMMAEGGLVYGEIPTGPITADTRAALGNRQGLSASQLLQAMKRIGSEGVSNLESLARGSVAAIPGAVGDIESIFRDDKKRKFATTEEVERQYLPKRLTAPTAEGAGFTEVGTYLPVPVDPGKVVRGARAVGRAAAPTVAEMMLRAAPAAQPMYAVKPKGGVFFPEGSGSRVDEYLDRMVRDIPHEAGSIPGKQAKNVAEFIKTKGRKYLTTTFGTGNDPLREAILEGRLPLFGSDKEKFRTYMLNAARAGDPEALMDLERAYDRAIQMQGGVVKRSEGDYAVESAKENAAIAKMREQMQKEGVSREMQNIDLNNMYTENLSRPYATDAQKMLDALMTEQRAPVSGAEQATLMAAQRGEPIYDLTSVYPALELLSNRSILQGIASIPAKDLERMSFPEAIVRGAQNTKLQRSWDEVVARAKEGKNVDKEFFLQGIKPVAPVGDSQWVQVTTPEAVRLEGAAMNHSVGGYSKPGSYGHGGLEAFQSGKAQVFSLRGKNGKPSVTVEAKVDDGDYYISQIKGPFNSVPNDEEKAAVFQLLDRLNPSSIKSEVYSRARNGDNLDKSVQVDWGTEFDTYRRYLEKNTD